MLNKLRSLHQHKSFLRQTVRNFLSANFKCEEAWNGRLSAPFMQKVNLDTFYYEIDQRFQQIGKAPAVDVDIFVNKMTDEVHLDEAADLLHKLRLSAETSNTLESTGHALIRSLLEAEQIDNLMQILNNRIAYGVFLDNYTASYVLDTLIKRKEFKYAAQTATFLMLQEDFENELARTLSLYACIQFLKNPEPFYPEKPVNNAEDSKDVVKVRVKFIRNEYFDDHFDLTDHNHLVGKTLVMIASHLTGPIASNVRLLGNVLYQKYNGAQKELEIGRADLYSGVTQIVADQLEKFPPKQEDEVYSNLKAAIDSFVTSDSLKKTSLETEIEQLVQDAVKRCEISEIENQEKIYARWCIERQSILNNEIERFQRVKRIKEIENLSENMKAEEQKLWFFENEDKIDLQIDSKKVFYPKRWFGKKKVPRKVDEGYIPPETRRERK